MPLKPDPAIWGALLNACRIHQNVELGELAAQKILEVDKQSIGYYVLLCNLYDVCSKWDDLARVRKTMRERGLIVDPGCSWIEVKGKVHAFLTDDVSHPEIKEVNAVLNAFYEKMEAAGLNKAETLAENASKAEVFCGHSERLAIAFGLINTAPGTPIWLFGEKSVLGILNSFTTSGTVFAIALMRIQGNIGLPHIVLWCPEDSLVENK
ncbi:hypothetical protein RDABS01_011834 [Bienertia sinuspersici]